MGKFFIDPSELCRVDFPNGEWVDIRADLTQSAKDRIQKKMITAKAESNPDGKTEDPGDGK